jgi:hypothetical protein
MPMEIRHCGLLTPHFTVFASSLAMTKPSYFVRADYPSTYGIAGWTAWFLNAF